jgi:endonuclease/exonuclease/phosphatase family metal-dependent hydrolase
MSKDGTRHSLDEEAAILAAIEPDVVMLQEAKLNVPDVGDLAQVLADRLQLHCAPGSLEEAVLSRYPISSWHEYVVPQPPHWPWENTGDKGIVIAHCTIGGASAHLVSTHYNVRSQPYRIAHAHMLVQLLSQLPADDLVLFGADVNTADVTAPEVQLLLTDAHLMDARSQIAPDQPVGYDVIMYRPANELRPTQYRLEPDPALASDHQPVVVDLDLVLPPVDNALVRVQVPTAVTAGATAHGSAQLENTGTTTWDPTSYALGLSPETASNWGSGTTAAVVPPLGPGQAGSVGLTIQAGSQIGDLSISWEMRHADAWFGGPALASVSVTPDQHTTTCAQLAAQRQDLTAAIGDIDSMLADPTLPKQARPQLMAKRKGLQVKLAAVTDEIQQLGC